MIVSVHVFAQERATRPPQPIMPATGTSFAEADIKKPITFRWTPVIPKPQDPVTYRLTVWQLVRGQTGPQAIKANQPIITKDVDNLTQAVITNIVDGPCKPPLKCDFVWNVQAVNREGKPIGGNNGRSETFAFKFAVTQPEALISNPNLHQNPGYLTTADNKGTPAQIDIEKGALKQNPGGYLKTADNNGTPAKIDIEGGKLKQNPQYLTAGDNKGGPDSQAFHRDVDNKGRLASYDFRRDVDNKGRPSLVAPQQKNGDSPAVTQDVSSARMVVSAGPATPGRAITGIDVTLTNKPAATAAGSNSDNFNGWASGQSDAINIVITTISPLVKGRIDAHVEESRILLFIKKDGKKICGAYTSATAPVAGLTRTKIAGQLRTSRSTGISDLLGEACILAPGQYELSVQFFENNYNKIIPLSDETTKSFTIKASTVTTDANTNDGGNVRLTQKPGNEAKADNKSSQGAYAFHRAVDNKGRPSSIIYGGTVEVKPGDDRPVFHWKANNPAPGQTYSLVISIVFKKSDEDAVETNSPVFEEKGIKETSFAYPASARKKLLNQAPVGTRSGELKKYAWVVTAWDASGKQLGVSEKYILGVNMSF